MVLERMITRKSSLWASAAIAAGIATGQYWLAAIGGAILLKNGVTSAG